MNVIEMITSITAAVKEVFGFIDDLHLSKEEKLAFHERLSAMLVKLQELGVQVAQLQSSVLVAEAQSGSWLARSWRPITMLSFVYVIMHNTVLVPVFNLPTVGAQIQMIPEQIWDLLKIGIGGYIGGRSAEKIAGMIMNGRKNNKEEVVQEKAESSETGLIEEDFN